jgi:hypothetical protein
MMIYMNMYCCNAVYVTRLVWSVDDLHLLAAGWVVVLGDNHIDNEFPEDAMSELPLDSTLPPETTD